MLIPRILEFLLSYLFIKEKRRKFTIAISILNMLHMPVKKYLRVLLHIGKFSEISIRIFYFLFNIVYFALTVSTVLLLLFMTWKAVSYVRKLENIKSGDLVLSFLHAIEYRITALLLFSCCAAQIIHAIAWVIILNF